MNATRARAEIVTWFEFDRFNAPRKRRGAHQQIYIRRPYRSLDDRLVTRVTTDAGSDVFRLHPGKTMTAVARRTASVAHGGSSTVRAGQ